MPVSTIGFDFRFASEEVWKILCVGNKEFRCFQRPVECYGARKKGDERHYYSIKPDTTDQDLLGYSIRTTAKRIKRVVFPPTKSSPGIAVYWDAEVKIWRVDFYHVTPYHLLRGGECPGASSPYERLLNALDKRWQASRTAKKVRVRALQRKLRVK